MKVTIVSCIGYASRVLAMVDIENDQGIYRTYFYRSTGSNVLGKDMWFPFSCISGPGALERTYMHRGWISKNMILAHEEFMKLIPSNIGNSSQHSDPRARLNAHHDSKITFDIDEVSRELFKQYEKNKHPNAANIGYPVEAEDVEFINTWITKGLRCIHPDKTKETPAQEPKKLTQEEEDILRSMMI